MMTHTIATKSPKLLLTMIMLLTTAFIGGGCDIVDKVYQQMKVDVEKHMFPEQDIIDESEPLRTDMYICDNARTLLIYKNEGTGTAVIEYEGKASFLERIQGTEDELYKNNQSTLRIRDDGMAELAREQVAILTNCEQQVVQHKKDFQPIPQ